MTLTNWSPAQTCFRFSGATTNKLHKSWRVSNKLFNKVIRQSDVHLRYSLTSHITIIAPVIEREILVYMRDKNEEMKKIRKKEEGNRRKKEGNERKMRKFLPTELIWNWSKCSYMTLWNLVPSSVSNASTFLPSSVSRILSMYPDMNLTTLEQA